MNLFSRIVSANDVNEMPDHIYCSVVRSLYAEARTLFVGILCVVAAPLVLFWKEGDPVQLIFCALFMFFGMARMLLANSFEQEVTEETSVAEYRKWETRYLLSGSAYFGIMGLWFMAGMIRSDDPFVHMLSLVLCLCFMIGIVGRNFGSEKVVIYQVLLISVLIITGVLFQGGIYNYLLAAFLVPFFVAIKQMASRLKQLLVDSVISSEMSRTIAERFNIALDNVMHGIAMFGKDGRMVVCNDRFLQLANLNGWKPTVNGDSLFDLERGDGQGQLAWKLKDKLAENTSSRFRINTPDHRTIEIDFNIMDGGGVAVLTDITEQMESEKVIRDLANFDPLTNLPNRRYFLDEVNRLLGQEGRLEPCAMFFVDLDKFKEVNDTLGHSAGDQLLSAAAERLNLLVDSSGLICRFGGDEFVIVMPGMSDPIECSKFAAMIIRDMQMPIKVDAHELTIGASVGIALAPRDADTVDGLLQNTDSALYNAKAKGRGDYSFYTDELGDTIRMRRQLEADLRTAIRDETIDVFFQPLINLKRGRINTCEALARWVHPEHGQISPEKFVKIAEEAGSINVLGDYVLRKAMEACLKWPEHVCVAVNVSSVQFQTSDVFETITGLLSELNFPANRLDIEVTESIMLENVGEATSTLQKLSKMGVRISLDDFGTGFSSLSYLHALPFDKVKIDRSFIENGLANDRSLTLLKGVVDLIKRLGLSVVLEGIETEKQMEVLSRSVDVNEVQGYLFSRPVPERDIMTLLNASLRTPPDQDTNRVA